MDWLDNFLNKERKMSVLWYMVLCCVNVRLDVRLAAACGKRGRTSSIAPHCWREEAGWPPPRKCGRLFHDGCPRCRVTGTVKDHWLIEHDIFLCGFSMAPDECYIIISFSLIVICFSQLIFLPNTRSGHLFLCHFPFFTGIQLYYT